MVKNMFSKLKKHQNGQPKSDGTIPLPEALQKKIEAHHAAFRQQAEAMLQQTRRNVELLVDGYVASLGLPDDTQLSFNHEKLELRVAKPAEQPKPEPAKQETPA